jgi:hypothetical protein
LIEVLSSAAEKGSGVLNDFIALPYDVYKGISQWTPPIKKGVYKMLVSRGSRLLKSGPYRLFVAYRNGKPLARVMAGIDEEKNAQKGLDEGYFSLFESYDDIDAAKAVMRSAEEWMKERGVSTWVGPVSPTNGDDGRGVMLGGFETPSTINTAYNPPFYKELFEKMGYEKHLDFLAYDVPEDREKRVMRVADWVSRHNKYDIRPINIKDPVGIAADVHKVYVGSMLAHWDHLSVPTLEQIREEVDELVKFADPDFAQFAYSKGEPVAFVVGLPDYNQVLRHFNGRLNVINMIRFLLLKKKIDTVRVFMQFSLPEHQKRGAIIACYIALYRNYKKKGYKRIEASTVAEFNSDSIAAIESIGGVLKKRYRLYKPGQRL